MKRAIVAGLLAGIALAAGLALWSGAASDEEAAPSGTVQSAPTPAPAAEQVLAPEALRTSPLPGVATRTLSGRVEDERGAPLAGFEVHATRPGSPTLQATSGADGRFAITGCDDEPYVVLVPPPKNRRVGRLALVRIAGAQAGTEVVLVVPDPQRRESSIGGRILDDRGRPLPDLVVYAQPRRTGPSEAGEEASEAKGWKYDRGVAELDRSSGWFSVKELPPGDLDMRVSAKDWYAVSFEVAGLGVGERRDVGGVILPVPARLAVELKLPDGAEDPDVLVEVLTPLGVVSQRADRDRNAERPTWRSGPLDPRQEAVLYVSGAGVAAYRRVVPLRAGETSVELIELERGVTLDFGFVLGPAKSHGLVVALHDADGVVVSLRPPVRQQDGWTTGTASVRTGLRPGSYTLRVEHNGVEAWVEPIDVPDARDAPPSRVIHVP